MLAKVTLKWASLCPKAPEELVSYSWSEEERRELGDCDGVSVPRALREAVGVSRSLGGWMG